MNCLPSLFDWTQARACLATAEAGRLTAAARSLGRTRRTLSRQVAALGVVLFDRVARTLGLTPTGGEILDQFRAMGEGRSGIALAASGQSQAIEGQVCITDQRRPSRLCPAAHSDASERTATRDRD